MDAGNWNTRKPEDLNPAYFHGPGVPVAVKDVETRLKRLDKAFRINAVAMASDYMWLRMKWKQEEIVEATQGQVTFKEYLKRITPRGLNYCYRLEQALYVITDYLELRYSTDLTGILSSKARMAQVENNYGAIGVTKLLMLGRECDTRDRLLATRRLIEDPRAFTIDELKLRLGRKVTKRPAAAPVVNLPADDEMTIEDRLFLIFHDIVGEDITEDELRQLIRRFGMDMLREIKTKIKG